MAVNTSKQKTHPFTLDSYAAQVSIVQVKDNDIIKEETVKVYDMPENLTQLYGDSVSKNVTMKFTFIQPVGWIPQQSLHKLVIDFRENTYLISLPFNSTGLNAMMIHLEYGTGTRMAILYHFVHDAWMLRILTRDSEQVAMEITGFLRQTVSLLEVSFSLESWIKNIQENRLEQVLFDGVNPDLELSEDELQDYFLKLWTAREEIVAKSALPSEDVSFFDVSESKADVSEENESSGSQFQTAEEALDSLTKSYVQIVFRFKVRFCLSL